MDPRLTMISAIELIERDITITELARIHAGFEENRVEHGNPASSQERHGVVAMAGERFIGAISGLKYHQWFYITDLWLEKDYRRQGLGSALLQKLEARVAALGVKNIYTWTAGFEAPEFYKTHGYGVFCELENYYSTGHGRIGVRKALSAGA
jgi:ribosomal protein S18 acetylase RimI-like enzyme